MKIRILWFATALVVFLLIVGLLYINQPAKLDMQKENVDYKLSANELFAKFEVDEIQANALYLNKVIEITGVISEVKEKQENELTVVLKNNEDLFGVLCTLKDVQQYKTFLVPGKVVRLKGVCKGYLSDVIVNNCVIIK